MDPAQRSLFTSPLLFRIIPIFLILFLPPALLPLSLPAAGSADGPLPQALQPEREGDSRGRIEADQLEFLEKGRIIEATGNAYLSYAQFWMRADKVRYDRETEEVVAEGKIFFTDGKSRLEGNRLEYNTGTGRGILYQGNGFFSPSLWVTGMEIQREDEKTYRLVQGSITTCPPEEEGSPDWEVRAKRTTVHLEDRAISRGASFWVKGIPVFYSPLVIGPASDRQSGFLIPLVGFSSDEGLILKNSYFWAINPSQDATFSLNYRSKRGFEGGLEYRYILSDKSRGYFDGLYTYDQEAEENRWKVTYRHQQEIRPQLNGKLNINLQNTNDYQRIYDPDTQVRSQRLLASEGYVAQAWPSESLMLWGNYTKDLAYHDHLYRLPEISLLSSRQLWSNFPLRFHLNSSAAYFERWQGRDVGRFDLYPRLAFPLNLGGLATFTPSAAFRETFHTREEQEHRSSSREVYQLQARLETRLSRTFAMQGETLEGVHHVIEPMVAYEYIPEVDQSDLPQYDLLDFVSPQNGFTYGLTTRLFLRPKGRGLREILALRLSQSYNIHGAHQQYPYPLLGVSWNELRDSLGLRHSERRFSDLNLRLESHPTKYLSLFLDTNYDLGGNHTDTIDPSVRLQLPWNVDLSAGYHYAPELLVHALEGKLDFKIRDFASVSYYTRYDWNPDTFRENKIELTYFSRCWSVTLAFIRRLSGSDYRNDFRFSFDLRGISGVK